MNRSSLIGILSFTAVNTWFLHWAEFCHSISSPLVGMDRKSIPIQVLQAGQAASATVSLSAPPTIDPPARARALCRSWTGILTAVLTLLSAPFPSAATAGAATAAASSAVGTGHTAPSPSPAAFPLASDVPPAAALPSPAASWTPAAAPRPQYPVRGGPGGLGSLKA